MGSTSGSCTLQEQAVAGTSVLTLPVGSGTVVANNVNSAIVSGTAVASTSGTSIDFTGIPSWAKKITVMFQGVSTSGTSNVMIQLGTSGGVTTSGYLGAGSGIAASVITANQTTGFGIENGAGVVTASSVRHGVATVSNLSSNNWVAGGTFANSNSAATTVFGGSIALGGTLDRVRITTVNGTDTFEAGSINIMWE
jgi:hypothetical protein